MTQAKINDFFSFLMLPPSIFVAGALISGILIQSMIQIPLSILYWLSIILAILSITIASYQKKKPLLILIFLPCIMFLIVLFGACRYEQSMQSYLICLNSIAGKNCSITGIVTDKESISVNQFSNRITIMTTEICDAKTNIVIDRSNHYIQIYTTQEDAFMISDSIFIPSVTIKKSSKKSFAHYLMKNGITTTLFLSNIDWHLINRPATSLYRFFYTLKHSLYNRAKERLSSETFSLYSALFLGKKNATDNPKNIVNEFRQWGVSHLLARSGMHLSLIALLWIFLFRVIPLPFFIKQFLLVIIALLYNYLSWSSVSFARALYSFLYYRIALLYKERIHLLHILALVCILFLIKTPILLFFVDFQLSFLLTASLIWLSETMRNQDI